MHAMYMYCPIPYSKSIYGNYSAAVMMKVTMPVMRKKIAVRKDMTMGKKKTLIRS